MLGIVYYGDQFVEVPDASVTLRDICESLGLAGDLAGVYLKHRGSGRVVATLAFEGLPAAEALSDGEEPLFDLCTPATHNNNLNNNNNNNNNESPEAMVGVLQQLLRLGAASLLRLGGGPTSELTSTETQSGGLLLLDSYDPRAAPGLLRRTLYPASIYSPYRHKGDPLRGGTNTNTFNNNNNNNIVMVGPPYISAVEPYVLQEATEAIVKQRSDLIPQSEEEAKDILQGLVAAATQAKAMIAMADVEEERKANVDVKPNIQLMQLN